MIEATTTTVVPQRGSCWGLDGLYYPAAEEREVPLSGAAIQLILYLYAALRQVPYPRAELVYVAADQFIYYEPHNPKANVAPDVWVCFDVPKEPQRPVFRTWEEGATPSFVVEVSSKESRAGDRGPKLDLYQDVLRCREYLIYDEERDELLLYRRQGDRFRTVPPGPDGRLHSAELEVSFAREPGVLVRVFDSAGLPVSSTEELRHRFDVEAGIRRRLELESAQLAEQLAAARKRLRVERPIAAAVRREAAAERARAQEADRRSAELADELGRLQAEVEELKQKRG